MGLVRRWGAALIVVAAAAAAAVFRIPPFLSTRQITYDDGVYAASVQLMRAGLDPFADFFSSQGPVFLPVLRLADMTGIGDLRAARLAMVVTGTALAVAMFLVAGRNHDRYRSAGAALLAASSGTLILAAGPLQSDGLALVLGLLAVVIATGDIGSKPWLAPVAGAVIALGLATKSLHLLPTALVVVTLVVLRGSSRGVAAFAISGTVTGLLVSLPWGLGNVWEQYVLFHLSKQPTFNLGEEVSALWELGTNRELPLLILLTIAFVLTVFGFRSHAWQTPERDGIPGWVVMAWAASTLLMILLITGVQIDFLRFGAFLVPPLILLVMRSRMSTSLVLVLAILAVPYQWVTLAPAVARPGDGQRAAIEILQDLPENSWVVTDEAGLAWSADRLSHPDTVDSSLGRLGTGSLETAEILGAIADEQTCAFIAWSGRYRSVGLADPPAEFTVVYSEGSRTLAIRPGC